MSFLKCHRITDDWRIALLKLATAQASVRPAFHHVFDTRFKRASSRSSRNAPACKPTAVQQVCPRRHVYQQGESGKQKVFGVLSHPCTADSGVAFCANWNAINASPISKRSPRHRYPALASLTGPGSTSMRAGCRAFPCIFREISFRSPPFSSLHRLPSATSDHRRTPYQSGGTSLRAQARSWCTGST